MHYCVHLFTKTLPTQEEIEEIMEPYNDDHYEEHPIFTWDHFLIGGRYGGRIKLKVCIEDEDEYEWKYYSHMPRESRLFYSSILNQIRQSFPSYKCSEEDYISYMGLNDGFIYVDGARVKDILNLDDISCYVCIDADKNVIARSRWEDDKWIDDTEFDEKYNAIKERSKDYFITVLDIHD